MVKTITKKVNKKLAQFLKVGLHLGHKKNQWNPKMLDYIYKSHRNYHIIDLYKTQKAIKKAFNYVKKATNKNKQFLFVGTRKSISKIIEVEAKRANISYINSRWLGGTLTNWSTIQKRIARLNFLETLEKYDILKNYPKKESATLKKELEKLQKCLGGIKNMTKLPDVVFLVDQHREMTAIKECKKLGIPIISIVDTNCDPDLITLPIPGNDDSVKAVKFLLHNLVTAISLEQNKLNKD
jgi:small subunit ribosomal protein S2